MVDEILLMFGGGVVVAGSLGIGALLMWLRRVEHDAPVLRVMQDANLMHHHNFKKVGADGFPTCVCGDRYTDAGTQQEGTVWRKDHWEAE